MHLVNHINYGWLRWFPESSDPLKVRAYFTYKTEPHAIIITKPTTSTTFDEFTVQIKGQHRTKFLKDRAVMEYLFGIAPDVLKMVPVQTQYVPAKHRTVYAKLNVTPH